MIEKSLVSHLIKNDEFARKIVPYVKEEYFEDNNLKVVYLEVVKFMQKYNTLPTKEALLIEIDENSKLSDDQFNSCKEIVSSLSEEETNVEYFVDTVEKWCQERAIYKAIMESIGILDGNSETKDKGTIPKLLSDALGVTFDPNIGHDLLVDFEERYHYYHTVEERIPFDLELLNTITKGGIPKKSLNIILAGTGVGKSLAMCHMATNNLKQGKNVLYITMEMAEERIAERIDANLLNITMRDLEELPKDRYESRIKQASTKTDGKLIVKEYPTACAGSGHFRHLLNELRLKKSFIPDIIYIDYLNICASSRIKGGANVNSYTLVKAIAEELRGLAVEFNIPIFSATQTTRSGFTNSDVGLEDTAESFGLPATADFMFALISTEELEELGQLMVKQLKNRYGDPNLHKIFVIGIDRPKMKLFDVEQIAQEDIVDDTPVFDKSDFGSKLKKVMGVKL